MNTKIKDNQGLSYLYILSFIILLFDDFLRDVYRIINIGDIILIAGFVVFCIMIFYITLVENKSNIISKKIPYFMVIGLSLSILFLMLTSLLGNNLRLINSIYFNTSTSVNFSVFIMIIFILPYITFKNDISKKAKIISVIMAIIYFVDYLFPYIYQEPGIGMKLSQYIKLIRWIELIFLALVYILYGVESKNKGTIIFTFCCGLAFLYYGLTNPVRTIIGGTYRNFVSSKRYTIESNFAVNWFAIIGIALITVVLISYFLNTKTRARGD